METAPQPTGAPDDHTSSHGLSELNRSPLIRLLISGACALRRPEDAEAGPIGRARV
jgi:hypothetical protein